MRRLDKCCNGEKAVQEMNRDDAYKLVCEFTQSDSLRKHMFAVEVAMRAYAKRYGEDVIYAIKSHADYLADCPRVSLMDKALYACDELAGFCTAVARLRPEGIRGMEAKSVRKKMKQASFAAAVSREDIARGAEELGVELDEHIQFVIDAMAGVADQLDLTK